VPQQPDLEIIVKLLGWEDQTFYALEKWLHVGRDFLPVFGDLGELPRRRVFWLVGTRDVFEHEDNKARGTGVHWGAEVFNDPKECGLRCMPVLANEGSGNEKQAPGKLDVICSVEPNV
jgi:hypothetical protein